MSLARRAVDTPDVTFPHEPPQRALADVPVLRPVSGRAPVGEYMYELWRHRFFVNERAWSLAVTQNRGMLLGNLWLILNPLTDAAVYLVIFGVLFASGVPNFPAYLIIGISVFNITNRNVTSAAGCVQSSSGLIRAFSFPRAALPIASCIRNAIESIPSVLVMLLLTIPFVGAPGAAVLVLPLVLVVHFGFDLGLAFIAARLGSDIPDMKRVIPTVFRFLMYGSAITFSIQRYEAVPWLATLVRHNPIYLMVDAYRQGLLNKTVPTPGAWLELAGWMLGCLLFGFWWFWRGEVNYGRPE